MPDPGDLPDEWAGRVDESLRDLMREVPRPLRYALAHHIAGAAVAMGFDDGYAEGSDAPPWAEADAFEPPDPEPTEPSAVPSCGGCGADMVRRKRKSDGHPFWGCSLYPKCYGTLDIPRVDGEDAGE